MRSETKTDSGISGSTGTKENLSCLLAAGKEYGELGIYRREYARMRMVAGKSKSLSKSHFYVFEKNGEESVYTAPDVVKVLEKLKL